MTATKASPYERALGDLHFSEEAQTRMIRNLEAQMTGATPTVPTPVPMSRRRMSRRAVVGLALAATLAIGGSAALATGGLTSVVDAFSGLLGSGPAQTELIDRLGIPVGAQATVDGVTITADAADGDAHGYAVLFSIARANGEPLALEGVKEYDGILANLGFTEDLIDVDGVIGQSGCGWFFDADPDDNAIQYLVRMDLATTRDGSSVAGRSATAHFGDLVMRDEEDLEKTTVVAAGPWDLAFAFDYEDATVEVALEPVEQEPYRDGRTVTVDALSVSPLGLYVTYTMDGVPEESPRESGRMPAEVEESLASYSGIPVVVAFSDGSTQEFGAGNGSSHLDTGAKDRTTVTRSCSFGQIVDLNDIASVTVGDVEYPIN